MCETVYKEELEAVALFPLLQKLCKEYAIKIDDARCSDLFQLFDVKKSGKIRREHIVDFARYVVVLAFLTTCYEWHDTSIKNSAQQIEQMLDFMKLHCEKLDSILPFLPYDFQEDLMSYDFEQQCIEDFMSLDKAKTGVLEPKELIPVILQLSQGHQLALTFDHVMEFVELFDTQKNGVITQSEFVTLSRFMMILAFLETEEGRVIAEAADIFQGTTQVDDLLNMLAKDRSAIHKVIPFLPQEVYDDITSDRFMRDCNSRFADLDKNKNGTLEPVELYPVIVELSEAHPYAIDEESCKQFTAIFDIHGDGVIRKDEFVDFTRFLCVMNYMGTDEGRKKMSDGLQIMDSSHQVDELLEILKRGRKDMQKVFPYLPGDLRAELLSPDFTENCLIKFKDLDKDSNGSLDPLELYPVIIDMAGAHEFALDAEQCKTFTAIFDDARTGVISQSEFVNFARFLMVMSYLQTEDGRTRLAIASADEREAKQELPQTTAPAAAESSEMKHMSVDLAYFQNKADKLTGENEDLRSQMFRMEDTIRRLETRMEEQDQRLRHAELDLRRRAAGRNN